MYPIGILYHPTAISLPYPTSSIGYGTSSIADEIQYPTLFQCWCFHYQSLASFSFTMHGDHSYSYKSGAGNDRSSLQRYIVLDLHSFSGCFSSCVNVNEYSFIWPDEENKRPKIKDQTTGYTRVQYLPGANSNGLGLTNEEIHRICNRYRNPSWLQ